MYHKVVLLSKDDLAKSAPSPSPAAEKQEALPCFLFQTNSFFFKYKYNLYFYSCDLVFGIFLRPVLPVRTEVVSSRGFWRLMRTSHWPIGFPSRPQPWSGAGTRTHDLRPGSQALLMNILNKMDILNEGNDSNEMNKLN